MTMLTVCIDYSSAIAHTAGVSRYVRELVDALTGLPDEIMVALLHNTPGAALPSTPLKAPHIALPYGIKGWRAAMLAGGRTFGNQLSRAAHFDVFHGPDSIVPALPSPAVMTIHDLTVLSHPHFHTRLNRLFMQLALPVMAKRARVIIADSHSTRAQIISRLHAAPDKVEVIYPGINHARFYAVPAQQARLQVAQRLGIAAPYVLALGTLEPRKNLISLLRAFVQIAPTTECDLVLAGPKGWGDTAVAQAIQSAGLSGRVHLPGFVPDDLLASLYAGAQAFAYPSWFEGFGFPILEAMACGSPVVCSNTSSLPELAADAALTAAPADVDALAALLSKLLQNPALRQTLIERGAKRVAQFTWLRTARETINVYRRAVG
jgi:glycosyltransferase involved in cell wall biosynthesis